MKIVVLDGFTANPGDRLTGGQTLCEHTLYSAKIIIILVITKYSS